MRPIIFILILIAIPIPTYAATLKVPSQYPTIQYAINASKYGDTVLVAPGTYYEVIDFNGKAITVRSEKWPQTTIIDGGQSDNVVTMESGEGKWSTLDGFTITNGFNSGINCYKSSPTIINNIISNNGNWDASNAGGGICCNRASPIIKGNFITKNIAFEGGGGVFCFESSAVISGNIISDNYASYHGGGISCRMNSYPLIASNFIFKNQAVHGGGIFCEWPGGLPNIVNNTIYDNEAIFGGGLQIQSEVQVTNSIIRNNKANTGHPEIDAPGAKITYCNVKGGWPGEGNIDAGPCFVDPANDDFHLIWLSPCINRGTNEGIYPEDIDGDPIPHMGTVDMGADEFTGSHSLQADGFTLIENAGGVVHFTLDARFGNNGRTYIMLGSITGTVPGIILPKGMAILPLNWDIFTNMVVDLMNTPVFSNFMGTLNGTGSASATFDTLAPIPGAAGLTLHFAYALNSPWDFVSNPVAIEILP